MIETLIMTWMFSWHGGRPTYWTWTTQSGCDEMIVALLAERPKLEMLGIYDKESGRCEITVFRTIQ